MPDTCTHESLTCLACDEQIDVPAPDPRSLVTAPSADTPTLAPLTGEEILAIDDVLFYAESYFRRHGAGSESAMGNVEALLKRLRAKPEATA